MSKILLIDSQHTMMVTGMAVMLISNLINVIENCYRNMIIKNCNWVKQK